MRLPPRVRLIVLFGGRSAEHDISRISASHVLRAVDPERYEVVPVAITRDGRWQLAEDAAFAKNPAARLDFFARRHSTWDERFNLYPVLRTDVAP